MRDFDARLIARNTGWLYLRSFAICLADLVTARIVLQALGVDGFGVFAAVSGVIGVISFLGGALDETFRRFLSAEIGVNGDVPKVLSAVMGIALLFAAFVLAVGETAGLFFIRRSLVLPPEAAWDAVWACQAGLLSIVFVILSKPFVALSVSAERMRPVALIGLARAVLLFAVACTVSHVGTAIRLKTYVFLLAAIEGAELAYWCIRTRDCRGAWLHPRVSGPVFRAMMRFGYLSSFKTFAHVVKYNGTEIVLNLGSGVAFNASWRVAQRLAGTLYTLTGNFLEAFSPQLVKLWNAQEHRMFFALLSGVELFSFFIMWTFAFPVLLFAPEIGRMWLGEAMPPQFAAFVRAFAVNVVFDSLAWPLHAAIIADTRLMRYQLVSSVWMASGFLFACGALAVGCPEWTAPAGVALANALAFAYRVDFLHRERGLDLAAFSRRVLLPVGATVAVSLAGAALLGVYPRT